MLILYLHNAQRYIWWILMLQITHRDAVAFLVWTDLIRKMRDIYIHICLFVCLSFTHNLFYFVFSICLSKIYSLYFCSKTNQTSISWNIGININQTKTLNYNYLWITKNPKTPPRTFVIWTSAMNTDVRMGNLYLLFFLTDILRIPVGSVHYQWWICRSISAWSQRGGEYTRHSTGSRNR